MLARNKVGFCHMCAEDVLEAMTQCMSCLHWVHNKFHILRYV